MTPNEITAERDRLRARFAVEAALSARREEKARADLVAARAETGERLRAEAEHLSTIAARERLLADREVELTTLREQVAALEGELADLRVAKQFAETTIAGLQLQRDTLSAGTTRPWTLPRNAACISRKRAAKPRTSVRPSPRKPVAPLNCAPNSTPARLPCVKRSGVPQRSRTTWLWRASSAEKAQVRPDQRLVSRAFARAETCPQAIPSDCLKICPFF